MSDPVLVWFRQDLRLADNPALDAVGGRPVLPVYVLDDAAAGHWTYGGAARWWLHHSLVALGNALARCGAPLLLRRGPAEAVLPDLAAAVGATEVHAARLAEPWARRQEERVTAALARYGRRLVLHSGALLHDPDTLRAGSGKPYGMYAPFAKALLACAPPKPLPAPTWLRGVPDVPAGDRLERWRLLPQPPVPDWAAAFGTAWTPGEAGAAARLERFLGRPLAGYKAARDEPAIEGSSGLSPHLRWGEISPRQVWHAALAAAGDDPAAARPFLGELAWRDFSYHLLWHRPELPERALRPGWEAFPATSDAALLRAWQHGHTGYPVVDAGMRQLWRIGWMHNRVRMVAASVLVKHLLQPWQDGAAWFWDTLVDADLANNGASWQWIAGSGIDAAPYFRVFNPVLQGERFDPNGTYVRRWVPELAGLPDRWLHRPWEAPEAVLHRAGLRLGETYPRPVVLPAEGRARALAAFATLRRHLAAQRAAAA